jgi:LSD1 subclass zinc finger protein
MAVNVVVVCPICKKPLRIPSDALGKKVRCPACQAIFVGQRDEFKPAAPTEAQRAKASDSVILGPVSSQRDEAVARPNGPPGAPRAAFTDDVVEELRSDAEPPAARRPALPKKKSWLPLILVLVGLIVVLPALGCGGIAVAFWLLAARLPAPSIDKTVRTEQPNVPPDEKLLTQDKGQEEHRPPDKPNDKSQAVKPEDKPKPDDKSQPPKPADKPKPDDKSQPPKPDDKGQPIVKAMEEEMKRAAAGVKLVPVDVLIGGVPFTVSVPDGAKVVPGYGESHVFIQGGDAFKINIQVGRQNLVAAKEAWKDDQLRQLKLKSLLVDAKDLLVSEHTDGAGGPLFHFVWNTTLGHLDFRLENDWQTDQFKRFNRKDCLLMAHCARTAALKNTYKAPNSAADLEKLGVTFEKNEQGKVTSVGLPPAFSDATLPYLVKAAPDLESLYLSGTQVGDEGLVHVAGLKKLRILILPPRPADNRLAGAGLVHLKALVQLEGLYLDGTGVRGASLQPLASLTGLKRLSLASNGLTGAGLEHLRPLTQLISLNLSNQPLTDDGLKHVQALTALQDLHLESTQVTGAGFTGLKGLKDIQILNLSSSPVTDVGMKHLVGLTKMRTMILWGTKVTDAGLEPLKDMTALESLDLTSTGVTGSGFAHLSKLESLHALMLAETKFSDANLKHLGKLKGLTELELDQTPVTGNGFAALKDLPELRVVNLGDTQLNDAGLAQLGMCKSLESLGLQHTKITDAGWKHLKGLDNLIELHCTDTAMTGAGADQLKGLTKLESLDMSRAKVNNDGLGQIKALASLINLQLNETPVSDAGLAHLKGMPKLASLGLNKTAVTDAGLENLKDLKSLRSLSVYDTKVTKTGAEKLKQALPEVEVYRGDQ